MKTISAIKKINYDNQQEKKRLAGKDAKKSTFSYKRLIDDNSAKPTSTSFKDLPDKQ